jgi:hypothetical protein
MQKSKVSKVRVPLTLRRNTVIPLTDPRLRLVAGGIAPNCIDSDSCMGPPLALKGGRGH